MTLQLAKAAMQLAEEKKAAPVVPPVVSNLSVPPPNFTPFLNCCDRDSGTFQWIGTGRDADLQLQSVCQWWFDRRHLFSLPAIQVYNKT